MSTTHTIYVLPLWSAESPIVHVDRDTTARLRTLGSIVAPILIVLEAPCGE